MAHAQPRRYAAEAWRTLIVVGILIALSALLGGCSAPQRQWWADHLPIIGEWIAPAVPVPKPLWMVAIHFVASLFADHPIEATGGAATVAATVRGITHGIPGTARAVRLAHKRTVHRAATATLDAEALRRKAADLGARLEKKKAHVVARAQKAKDLNALKDKMAAATDPVLPPKT